MNVLAILAVAAVLFFGFCAVAMVMVVLIETDDGDGKYYDPDEIRILQAFQKRGDNSDDRT